MSLKALFFDFGGTIDLYPEIRENALIAAKKMLSILETKGLDLPRRYAVDEFYDQLIRRFSEYKKWKARTLIELASEQVWKKYLLFDVPDIDVLDGDTAEELTFLVETGRYTRQVRPEMTDVMEDLITTDLHMGIISNVLSLTQVHRNLKDYGLERYFSTIVLSSEFGMVKPHPSIFHFACETAKSEPGECIYVGNSPFKDIHGARNAGFMAAVQIEYIDDSDDTTLPGAVPDHYIRSMRELPEIIRSYL